MPGSTSTTLEGLERQGWDALCDGTAADFYGRLMTPDAVMVLANGAVLDRAEVVAALAEAPPWASYRLEDLRVVDTGPDSAALVYRGTARRDGQDPFAALMTSVYVRRGQEWRLALYTQTPAPPG